MPTICLHINHSTEEPAEEEVSRCYVCQTEFEDDCEERQSSWIGCSGSVGGGHTMTALDTSVCLQKRKIGTAGTVNININNPHSLILTAIL